MPESLLDLSAQEEERARALHDDAIFIDGTIPRLWYLSEPDYRDHLKQGGFTAANFTVAHYPHNYSSASQRILDVYDWVEASSEFKLVRSASDIEAVHASGQTGVIMGFQDTKPIEDSAEYVRAFSELGVRVIQLTYNTQNLCGAGACDRGDSGLTRFGEDVIDAVEEENVLLDLSHCADKTTMDAIAYADGPVAFTHVGVRELCNAIGRCKTDEQIKAVADSGGVIGFIAGYPPLVKRDPETYEVLESTIHDVLDGIEYLVDLVGVDHVGIGTDMNDKGRDDKTLPATSSLRHHREAFPEVFGRGSTEEYGPPIAGLERHTEMGNLTRGLVSRGFSHEDIRKILGENFCDLFARVWGH